MAKGKKVCSAFAAFVFASVLAVPAVAQVTTRFVNPGLATTSKEIFPGQSVTFEVRLDTTVANIGGAFRISQTSPGTSGYFTITGRSFAGSIWNDTTSGTADGTVLGAVSALLDPSNDDNLGRNTTDLSNGAAAGTNLFALSLTLASNASTPPGTYRIQPTPGVSFVTSGSADSFTDYSMDAALFDILVVQTLTVTKSGVGTGTVTANAGDINCGATCSDTYPGTTVTLTATPTGGSTFAGWSGAGCSGTGTCVVTVDAAKTVNAQFDAIQYPLTVNKTGSGSGAVSSAPSGINCGATCNANFNSGTVVTLTATPATGSTFNGWSGGGCSGTGTCVVTMSAATTITADFVMQTFTLTVNKTGAGTGTVTSTPSGINCGGDCDEIYNYGTAVQLTATPTGADVFTGWSGSGCSGTGVCNVTMTAARTVTANFAPSFSVTVNKAGSGSGNVTSTPAGINCGATCSAAFGSGTAVSLARTPDVGSVFAGWSGGCTGTGACNITVNSAVTVTATFNLQQFALNVSKTGNGTGVVTSAPAGINCGATCSANYDYNTVVTLSATPDSGKNFGGWSGSGCSGTGTCVVTMDAARSVQAQFTDTIPPDTTIVSGPSNPSNDSSPQFFFTSNEPGGGFQCSLNGASFQSCSSPTSVSVGNGTHTFRVRAVDAGGNADPEPAIFEWTVEGVVVARPAAQIPTMSEWALLLMSLFVAGVGIAAVRRRIRI